MIGKHGADGVSCHELAQSASLLFERKRSFVTSMLFLVGLVKTTCIEDIVLSSLLEWTALQLPHATEQYRVKLGQDI